MLKKRLYLVLPLALLAALLAAAGLGWLAISLSGEEMRQENIRNILAMETPVFYRDGQEKIGVFFREAHRQYISYEEIPQDFVNAIVAAEDNTFFSHHGVDFSGILRAMLANLRAGKVVQGGSTITQQTAKNLFKRKSRSFASKLKELLYAVQLEYHYPKKKIMEFYANQFYVSGNGHGLGVAARYFFDKTVDQLDLLECAFIAGSVKRPNYYNPFIHENEEAASQTRERARERTAYVLNQMVKLGMIEAARCQEQLRRNIDFHKGKMQYPLNTLMDMAKKAISTNEVVEALAQHGIDNIATSGVRIITTVDKALQESSEYILARELSNLDVRLSGYQREEVQGRYRELTGQGDQQAPAPGAFLFGRITGRQSGPSTRVEVALDNGVQGRIDEAGFKPMLAALAKWKAQPDLTGLLAELHTGDRVLVSVRAWEPKDGVWLLDLEKYPLLQGAVLVRQDGVIRAMVGGMENQFYNRAVTAKRSMGSAMKPLVYAAALQLGWNAADALNNTRDVFEYQGAPYFPHPDHESPHAHVSMNWAGTHSENLASVWLLYHLCDQLKPGEFKELAARLGMARQTGESYEQYKARIRDKCGIIVDQDALYRAAFSNAVKEMEPDLAFAGKLQEFELLKDLHYGLDFDKFDENLQEAATRDEGLDSREHEELAREIGIRRQLLVKNFLHFKLLRQELAGLQSQAAGDDGPPRSGRLYRNELTGEYHYTQAMPATGDWLAVGPAELAARVAQVRQDGGDQAVADFWGSIQVGGLFSSDTIDQLTTATEKEYKRLSGLLPYSEEVLHNISDFRVAVGLRYITGLGRELGITSELNPVLSFPLGSNVISLLETTRVYEGLASGSVFVQQGEDTDDLAIIERIEDSDGEIIYQPQRTCQKMFDDRTTLAVRGIMRNVVKFGTGRAAADSVILQGRSAEKQKELARLRPCIPLFGKTGTANRFTNSAFAGYVPGLAGSGCLAVEHGFTIAAYVGYDDNRPMTRPGVRITGAAGALPIWIKVANALLLQENYAAGLDLSDSAFSSTAAGGRPEVALTQPALEQMELAVSAEDGLPRVRGLAGVSDQESPAAATVLTFGELNREGEFLPLRYFQPYWQQQE